MKIDGSSNSRKQGESKVLSKPNKPSVPSSYPVPNHGSSNLKTYGDFTFDMDSVTSKFSKALQEKLKEEPASLAANGHYKGHSDLYETEADADGVGRSKADRILAIKNTAATLQNRLKEEAEKIKAQTTYRTEGNYYFWTLFLTHSVWNVQHLFTLHLFIYINFNWEGR